MKKVLALMCAALLMALPLTGCGPSNKEKESGDRPTLKLFIINGNYSEGATKDSVWKAMEDAANVNIEISGMVNNDDYYTTLSPRLNSASDMPDVFFSVPNGSGGAYYTWANQSKGILYDWTNLMAGKEEDYPYLNKIFTSEQYKNVMFEQAHTLLPFCNVPNSGWGIYYRGDWLMKVGYYTEDENGTKQPRVPVNMDEFQDVMMKFSDASYNLNPGKKTYGMSPFAGEWANQPLYHAFGAPTDYDLDENGNVEFMCLTEGYKNFLSWFSQCYRNGWIDPQFYTNTPGGGGDAKAFEEGRTGILITNAAEGVIWNAKPMEEIWGKGTCVMGPPPTGTATVGKEGAGGFSNWGGMWGGFSVTKACTDTDAALRLFNYLYSPEGQMTRTYGIEGVHWSWNETKTGIVPDLENRNKEPEGAFSLSDGVNGDKDLYGKYRFASILGGSPIIWDEYDKTGTFAFFEDYDAINPGYAHLMKQSAQYFNMVETSKLVNFTVLPQEMNKKAVAIADLCSTYAVQAIAGQKNLDSDWEALRKACEADGLTQIFTIYQEAVKTYGLLK